MKKIAALTLVLAMALMIGIANAQQQNPQQGTNPQTGMVMHCPMMQGMQNSGGMMHCPMMRGMQQGGSGMMQGHQGNGAAQTTPPAAPSKP